ncbi:MAG: hypothetical protein MK110_05775 [Fuerstiella sp.]|nr:hypothetical protein [Fuerstiella sp.]
MAKQSNGTLFTLAFFILAAVGCGIALGMVMSNSTALTVERDAAVKDKNDADGAVRQLNSDKEALLEVVGRPGTDVGQEGVSGSVVGDFLEKMDSPRFSNLADGPKTMEHALDSAAIARDIQAAAAINRQREVQSRTADLERAVASKDEEISVHQTAREQAELELQKRNAKHSEEIDEINNEFNKIKDQLENLQTEYDNYVTDTNRQLSFQDSDIREKRSAIQALRRELFEQEDISFATADGVISSVDHVRELAYVNLGSVDQVRVGTTFSVYVAAHGGIGRRNTKDIKASIEIVDVLESHLSEAKITRQDLHRPIAKGDPIYSPVFTAGLPVEVAIAGLIDFDGSPGSDRDELLNLVAGHGAHVSVQINDEGEFATQEGETLTEEEAVSRISEKTRFLIIADLGRDATDNAKDKTRLNTYRNIQLNTGRLQLQAENHGVYEIGLSTFLEFLGYTRKRVVWRAGQEFSARLVNGAKSRSVNASIGNRVSGGTVSARYSSRRTPRPTAAGTVSALYK